MADKLFFHKDLICTAVGFTVKWIVLGDIMYFIVVPLCHLRRKEAIFTQSSLVYEGYDKIAPNCKYLASNTEAVWLIDP